MTRDELNRLLEPPTVSVVNAGAILGWSKNSTYAAVKRGELPVIRLGHKARVPTEKLKQMLGMSPTQTAALAA